MPSFAPRPVTFDPPRYVAHLMGLTALLAWQSRWRDGGEAMAFEGPVLVASSLASQRFALGFPLGRRPGTGPFLAVQADEATFFQRLEWSQAHVDAQARRLILTTARVQGDNRTVEDLPAMGLALSFDVEDKLEWLLRSTRLVARPLWFDEHGHHVGPGIPLAQWRVAARSPDQPLFPPGALTQERTLRDLVEAQLAQTNRPYQAYAGTPDAAIPQAVALDPALAKLLKPFQPSDAGTVPPPR